MSKELQKPNDLVRLESIKKTLIIRAKTISLIREFFNLNGYLEIDTPIAIKSPAPEDYINAPKAGDLFLRSSPELHMKRIVAAGYDKIYQIGKCFREGEKGKLHNVEFTMLEWYESNSNYDNLLAFLKEMLVYVSQKLKELSLIPTSNEIDFRSNWFDISITEAFEKFADCDINDSIKNNLFELVLMEQVEPKLPKDIPVILRNYPKEFAALSKLNTDGTAERFELYLNGIEIANAYSELTDFDEQKRRFKKAHKNRENAKLPPYPEDNEFFAALKYGITDFTGCALGIDRLVMIFACCKDIKETITFI